jgi:hypothetical protein
MPPLRPALQAPPRRASSRSASTRPRPSRSASTRPRPDPIRPAPPRPAPLHLHPDAPYPALLRPAASRPASARPAPAPPSSAPHLPPSHVSTSSSSSAVVGKGGKAGRSRMEPRKRGSVSPSEAARGFGTSSTPGVGAIFNVWEGSGRSRSWSRSPPRQGHSVQGVGSLRPTFFSCLVF